MLLPPPPFEEGATFVKDDDRGEGGKEELRSLVGVVVCSMTGTAVGFGGAVLLVVTNAAAAGVFEPVLLPMLLWGGLRPWRGKFPTERALLLPPPLLLL